MVFPSSVGIRGVDFADMRDGVAHDMDDMLVRDSMDVFASDVFDIHHSHRAQETKMLRDHRLSHPGLVGQCRHRKRAVDESLEQREPGF